MEDLEKFYDLIHAKVGYRAICTSPMGIKGPKIPHWAASTRELLVKNQRLLTRPDIYHTCHTFEKPNYKKGDREGKRALWFNCLCLDIDIKDGKGEEHEDIVFHKLIKIEDHYGSKLQINSSGGGGFHVYLPFMEFVSRDVWQPLSRQILSLTSEIKGIDSQCTIDASRILRVPGSIHSRTGQAIKVLQWGDSKYRAVYVNGHKLEAEKNLKAFEDGRYKTVTLDELVDTCGHIRQLAAGWEGQPYDSWLGCATILKRVENGEQAFYDWSSQASNYDEDAARRVIETTTGEDAQACDTFFSDKTDAQNPCFRCAFKNERLNPLKLCLRNKAENVQSLQPSEMEVPEGYSIKDGWIYYNKDKGGEVYIASNPFFVSDKYQDPVTYKNMINLKYRDHDEWRDLVLPMEKAVYIEGSKLAQAYIHHEPSKWVQYLQDAIRDYEKKKKAAEVMTNFFGWKKFRGEDVFVLGRDVIGQGGMIGHAHIDAQDEHMKEVCKYLTPTGGDQAALTEEAQKLMTRFLADKTVGFGSKLQVAASYMAPLLHFASEYAPEAAIGGVLVNVFGMTGKGKSLGVKTAMSVWGKPGGDGLPGLLHNDISPAAVWLEIDKTRHLPFALDEMLSNPIGREPKALDDFIKAISNAKSPGRATSDGKARGTFSFNCPVISSSQTSLMEFIETGVDAVTIRATQMRIFEYETPNSQIDLERASPYDRFFSLYGVLGRKWLAYFLQPDIRLSFINHLKEFKFGGFRSEARYIAKFLHMLRWVCAHTMFGKAGVGDFPAGFAEEFEQTQKEFMAESESQAMLTPVQNLVLSYISKHKHNSLIFATIPNGLTQPRDRHCMADCISTTAYQTGNVMMIEVIEPDATLIPVTNFKTYCREVDRSKVIGVDKALKQLVREKSCRIAEGVQLLGLKDPHKKEVCYVFPRAILQLWQSYLSGIAGGSQPET